jgi:ATP-dependent DNA helicase RecQ
MSASLDEARAELKRAFGYDDFRKGQAPLVEALLAGRDCLGVMPTGAGKSICYQVPSLLLDGVTVVVSPLVSLMEDQVSALVDAGVKAACVSSQLSASEQGRVLARAANGAYDLLYVAPERLEDPRFADFAQRATIALVAVDEAHCVSQWGQDFRPSYLKIGAFIASLPARPIVGAFTATATERVRADIVRLLELRDPVQVTTGFDRPNLRFSVEELSDKRKLARIMAYVTSRPDDSGIIYCATRKSTPRRSARR